MLTKHDLVPLELAARAVYRRVYEAQDAGFDRLNGIAHAIAAQLPLYTYDDAGEGLRLLRAEELAGGQFQDGGRAMSFADGRPRLERLAVSPSGLERVYEALAAQGGS